jgi:hypothetical protein
MANRFTIFFLLIFNCIFISCKAQNRSEKHYADMILKGNKLFALTESGHINTLDANSGAIIDTTIHSDTTIAAMNIDRKGNIVVITNHQKIDILDERNLTFKNLFISANRIFNIVFDKNNRAYIITAKGITDITAKKNYLPDTTVRLNSQVRGWSKPSAVFMDKDDNIWLGYGFGEWGGELFVFNTQTGKFIKPILNKSPLEPVKSIFTDGNAVYISCGVQHMETYGCIIKFVDYSCSTIFISDSHWVDDEKKDMKKMIAGEYIGPATYNKKDTSIYFYSQNGLFKGNVSKDLSQTNNWVKIASPKLRWTYGQPDAVGSPMNVLKMSFAENGKLFIVAPNDGIGVYDGKTFHLLN